MKENTVYIPKRIQQADQCETTMFAKVREMMAMRLRDLVPPCAPLTAQLRASYSLLESAHANVSINALSEVGQEPLGWAGRTWFEEKDKQAAISHSEQLITSCEAALARAISGLGRGKSFRRRWSNTKPA